MFGDALRAPKKNSKFWHVTSQKVDMYKGFDIHHCADGHYVGINEKADYEINSQSIPELKYDIDNDESDWSLLLCEV